MIKRLLYEIAFSSEWGRQMRFITGPRQTGKTTLAKMKLKENNSENLYYLWDLRSVRNRYKENELFFTSDDPSPKRKKWICFDEIHKMPKWKNMLKGIFDETEELYNFIITGSAKLSITKKAGDSLAGRYFTFQLFPFILNEISRGTHFQYKPESADVLIEKQLDKKEISKNDLDALLSFGGFPEPFLKQNKTFYNKWSSDYCENVIKEDISALTNVTDREYIYDLYQILPEMIGSPISESSLASHIQVSSPTIKNYLKKLEDFYLTFSVKPYSKNIKRALIKAAKHYLFDWSKISEPAARFENYVACELKSRVSLWKDATGDDYQLFFIRDKEKKETDFLITKNEAPWLLVEVKLSDKKIDSHHYSNINALGKIPFIQICQEPGIASIEKKNIYRISAGKIFA